MNLHQCTDEVLHLNEDLEACGCGASCAATDFGADGVDYRLGLRIASIFIVALGSALGVLLPILGKRFVDRPWMGLLIFFGKSFGIGIVLACALIHMLQPAVIALSDQCLPHSFVDSYHGYAFLFALLGALCMQGFDMLMSSLGFYMMNKSSPGAIHDVDAPKIEEKPADEQHRENPVCHSHPATELERASAAERMVQAAMLEFSFTVHSVFIGLTAGIVTQEFEALFIALVFHQFFEGISIGSRIIDARFQSVWTVVAFTAIFALSAPLGIAIGVLAVNTLNLASVQYLLVQGVFDGLCAGILLYAGFGLLLVDFPRELAFFIEMEMSPVKVRLGGLLSIWLGCSLMAILGMYL